MLEFHSPMLALATPSTAEAVLPLRVRYRQEMNGQIVHDSIHRRDGWTVTYILTVNGVTAGFGLTAIAGPWKDKPSIFEFYVLPEHRGRGFDLFEALLTASGARFMEIQSSDVLLKVMLHTYARDIWSEKIVFHDAITTALPASGAIVQRLTSDQETSNAVAQREGGAEYQLLLDGATVGIGGLMFHYNQALLCSTMNRKTEALGLERRSLAIREKMLASEHPNVARSLNNLATLYYEQGWYGQAEPLFLRAVSIMENSLGPEHPDLVGMLNNLAVLYGNQGRYTQAESLLRRTLVMGQNSGRQEQIRAITKMLADLYRLSGRYSEAEPLLRHWLDNSDEMKIPDGELAAALLEHGFILRKMHRKSEAKRSEARAHELLKSKGPSSKELPMRQTTPP